jgi:hypothetical protein
VRMAARTNARVPRRCIPEQDLWRAADTLATMSAQKLRSHAYTASHSYRPGARPIVDTVHTFFSCKCRRTSVSAHGLQDEMQQTITAQGYIYLVGVRSRCSPMCVYVRRGGATTIYNVAPPTETRPEQQSSMASQHYTCGVCGSRACPSGTRRWHTGKRSRKLQSRRRVVHVVTAV